MRANLQHQILLLLERIRDSLGGIGVLDALNLHQGDIGVGVALATLVGQVLALDVYCDRRNVSLDAQSSVSASLFERERLTSVVGAGRHLVDFVVSRTGRR